MNEKQENQFSTFSVQVKPNSKNDKVEFDSIDDRLIVHLKAKAIEGKANKALIKILEKSTKRKCHIRKGLTSRNKIVDIEGVKREIIDILNH